MEIPGIGEKMVDKIYQAVNRFYEGGAAAGEAPAEAAAAEAEPAENSETATAVEEAPGVPEVTEEATPASSEGDQRQAEETKS